MIRRICLVLSVVVLSILPLGSESYSCLEDEACWNCETMGNYKCELNPDLEDRRK